MPAISIIVPIYNIEDCLEECLDSIASQTFADFEALCVIDGSEDGSYEIARRWAKRDSRFVVFVKENGGLSSARNYGIDRAGGDIVVFVDGDDTIEPACLERIQGEMQNAGVDVLVFGASPNPSEAANDWLKNCLSPRRRPAAPFSVEFMFSEDTTPYVWRCAVRRSLLVAKGLRFDESLPFGEDVAFQFALYPRAQKLASISDKLYRYRLERSGSLMDGHQDRAEKLAAHALIVETVLREWEGLGLLGKYCRELFEWSVSYLTLESHLLADDQRIACMDRANDIWSRYFPDDSCSAQATSTCLCRGNGKFYVACTVRSAPFDRLDVQAKASGVAVPAGAYPLSRSDDGREQEWVLELPWLSAQSIEVSMRPDGRACEQVRLTVSYRAAKWLSRLNYRTREKRCLAIRDFEQTFTYERFQVAIEHRFRDGDDAVWRFRVSWVGSSKARLRFDFADGRGMPMEATCVPLEYQLSPEDDLRENCCFVSVRLTACRHFVMTVADETGAIQSGFVVVDPAVDDAFAAGNADYVKAADEDVDGYRRWLAAHQAAQGELDAQRRSPDARVSFCIVVDAACADGLACEQTLRSLSGQTHSTWSALVLGSKPSPELCAIPGSYRVEHVSQAGERRLEDAVAWADADYCIFVSAGSVFEPDALYWFARKAIEGADVVFSDEDAVQGIGLFGDPSFKSRFNLDLLYGFNWMGSSFAIKRKLLMVMPPCDEGVLSAWTYERLLRAYEAHAKFVHVPRMLLHVDASREMRLNCHSERSGESSRGDIPSSSQYPRSFASAQDGGKAIKTRFSGAVGNDASARRLALEQHFSRCGIAADVEGDSATAAMRVRYHVPEPMPLVSVVIPSKDQSELLEACVRSLMHGSEYRSLEVIVVENNSKLAQTAARYDALEQEFLQVKIVHWPGEFNYSSIVNFGASQATGDYLLFLNNDTELIAPDSIGEMVGILQRDEVGVVGGKLLFRDGLVQHAGAAAGSAASGAIVHVNQNRGANAGGYQNRACLVGDFTAVTGACQMVRRAVFDEVGGYDERFAVGFNDIDFCMRLQRAGYLVVFTPHALFYHYEFASRGREVAGDAKMLRWKRESALFMGLWPELFIEGDPFTNPNLEKDNRYYRLDWEN